MLSINQLTQNQTPNTFVQFRLYDHISQCEDMLLDELCEKENLLDLQSGSVYSTDDEVAEQYFAYEEEEEETKEDTGDRADRMWLPTKYGDDPRPDDEGVFYDEFGLPANDYDLGEEEEHKGWFTNPYKYHKTRRDNIRVKIQQWRDDEPKRAEQEHADRKYVYNFQNMIGHAQPHLHKLINEKITESTQEYVSFISKPEYYIKIMESTLYFYQLVQKSTDADMTFTIIKQYIIALTGRSFGVTVYKYIRKAQRMLAELSVLIGKMFVQGDEEKESYTNPFSLLRDAFESGISLRNNVVVEKLYTIMMYIMSFSLADNLGITFSNLYYSKAQEEAKRKEYANMPDFIVALIDGSVTILERLYDVARTGSWSPILHSGKAYSHWIDLVYKLKEQTSSLHNPEAAGFSIPEYMSNIDLALEQGATILKYAPCSNSEKTLIKRLLSEVRILKANNCTKRLAQQSRDAPFGILLHGGSSLGKTRITDLIFQHFGNLFDLPTTDEYKYVRTFSDEFWSGFTPSQWFFVLDDVASKNPNLGQDPSTDEVLQIMNNTPFTPPQAELELKGKTPINPHLVIATTNTKTLNAGAYYCNTLAIARRFPIVVTVYVKSEYAKDPFAAENARMIDPIKLGPLQEGDYPDYWIFDIQEVVPHTSQNGQQTVTYKSKKKFTSILEFMQYISIAAKEHRLQQFNAKVADKAMKNIVVCKSCYHPTKYCKCEQTIQGKILPAVVAGTLVAGTIYYNRDKIKKLARNYVIKYAIDQSSAIISETLEEANLYFVESLRTIRKRIASPVLTALELLSLEKEIVGKHLSDLGSRAQLLYCKNKLLLSAIIALPTLVGLITLYKSFFTTSLQGNAISSMIGGRLTVNDEKPNPWYKEEYNASSLEVGRKSLSWKGLTNQQVEDYIFSNCGYMVANVGSKLMPSRIFCITGQLYVTNAHNIPKQDCIVDLIFNTKESGLTQNFQFFMSNQTVYYDDLNDLAYFELANMPPKKNLMELFPHESFSGVYTGYYINRHSDGSRNVNRAENIRLVKQQEIVGLNLVIDSWTSFVKLDTVKGECGTPLILDTANGPIICGIHQLGGSRHMASAISITQEKIAKAIEYFGHPQVQSGIPRLESADGATIQLNKLHHKSVFRYIDSGVADVYGSIPGHRPSHSSSVTDTYIRAAVEKRGYKAIMGSPVMKGWGPWRNGAVDIVQQTFKIDQSILNKCVKSFTEDILGKLEPNQMKELIILDDVVTLNGQPGVRFIDSMNKQSSMGFPWNRSKKFYLDYKGNFELWQDCVEFTGDFYDRVSNIITTYKEGTRYMPIYVNHLKDEPIKQSKIDAQATRLFSSAPADWVFTSRKYLLTFARVMQNNKYIFEAAPGTNAVSSEWDVMYHWLTDFGKDRIVAGDYSKFDKRMSAQMILAAYDVIINILRKANWAEEDLLVVRGIAMDTAFPISSFNGDLVQFWGSNPSGHPLTVIINSLANSLYVRYAWYKAGNLLSVFQKFVHLMTYGDDNIMGICRSILNFNHTIMQKYLAEIDVKYTMADKEAISAPFINIDDASFLKRTWRFDSNVGSHVAQIEHASIEKMLTKCVPSKAICLQQHAIEVMACAVREYFMYGPKTFNEKRAMFLNIVSELELENFYQDDFPTYDELLSTYKENSGVEYHNGCTKCMI